MEENPDDPYDTLGVQRGATPERIKEAYDDKVRLRSDKEGGNLDQADEEMKALTAAYSILKDPEKRAEYDLSLGGGAGAAVSSKGSVQASSSRGECLTEPEEDGAQNEAGSSAVGKDPDSQVVAVGNEETAAVVEIKAEIEDEASGVDRAVQELLHNKGVATSNSTSDEIQPATDVSDHASTSSPAEVESATGKLWRRAIEKKNPGKLLRLFEEDASNFWKHEREGRTALHIAAMDVTRENVKLTKSILDELLKVRRRNYTEELGEVFRNFSVNVRDYIGAVERESGKTAMTLAEEYFWWEANSKAICEHITVTLKLSEKLVDMDRAVARLKEHSSFPAEVENQTGELWRDAIEKKDLAVLQLLFEEDASNFWKHEREGRTALHVAAMDDTQKNVILAKSILDELLKVRRRNYTDELKDEFRNFSVNVRDYIGAVERESGKTAMTLAEENSKRPKTGRDICEHITATLKLNEEHFGIDRAVARLKQRSGSRAEVENQTGELWRDAIEKKDPAVLLLLFKEDASNFWEHEMAGCTALHVAAMGVNGVNLELAKLILHKLLKVRRRNYTEELGEEFRNFPVNVQDYIGAVERDSGKTAMELAKINYGNFENRKPICKHITITLNLSEEYVDVDRAVERLKERSSFPAEVDNQIGELWRNAIEEKDPAVLLLLFKADASNFWKHELWEGRTALHVAAMGVTRENLELAKSILDELLKVRRRNYTEKLGKVFRNFSVNVRGYIGAVERESGKTAMELAKEKSDKFATGKAICEHIIVTLNLNEEHFGIDRAVETQNEVERGTKLKRDKFPSPTFHGQLSSLIWSQNCEFLLRCFKKKSSWDIWKYKDESGRTVLHVAAMQGCFPLARELLDLARDGNDHGYIEAVDSQSNLTALQMADDIIGNRSIAEYIKFTLERMKNKEYEHPGFFEAYPRTSWRRALARGDCRTLKNMVSSNPRLLLETCKGLTVLHVAIICQALDLVKAVLNWFERTVTYGSSYYPQTPTWKQMFKKEAHFDGNVFADPFPRSSVPGIRADEQKFISAFESLLRDRGPFKGSAEELVTFMQLHELMESDSEMVQVLKNYDGTGVEGSEQNAKGVDDSAKRKLTFSYEQFMVELLLEFIKEGWHEEWNKGYEADVDFNFEKEPRLTSLRLHYACKYPHTFKKYLKRIIRLTKDMTPLYDAQGRTFYHVLVDHCNNEDHFPGRWILNEVCGNSLKKYLIEDARGRTINEIRLTKNYLQFNIFLTNKGELHYGDFERRFAHGGGKKVDNGQKMEDEDRIHYSLYDPMDKDDYAMCFGAYLIARALKQSNVAQYIWSEILEKNIKNFKIKDTFEPILFFAASTGDQEVLRMLLESKDDCTIPDANGRTALHHAANASLFEFATLLDCPWTGHCFSTVNDFCEVQRKWNFERNQMTVSFPQRSSEKESDVEKLVNVGRQANILMLLQAGVDLSQDDDNKKVPNLGPTNDAEYQTWWYTTVVKDTTEKKNSFNQAASAISIVGTLVAATSYIGPLQPPMTYDGDGYVRLGVKLVEVFMVSNTLAFYLAMTSVMSAVVPALPMPRESVLSELKRAQHTVAFSLGLLLLSIVSIIISFAVASMVVIQDHESFNGSGLLTFPSIIGWIFCLVGIVSFLIRILRLILYDDSTIRWIYQFNFIEYYRIQRKDVMKNTLYKRNLIMIVQ